MLGAIAAIFILFIMYICLAILSAIVRVFNSIGTGIAGSVFGCIGIGILFFILIFIVMPLIF